MTASNPAKSPLDVVRHGLTHYEYARDMGAEEDALFDLERLVEAASETARLYPYEGRLVRAALASFAEEPS